MDLSKEVPFTWMEDHLFLLVTRSLSVCPSATPRKVLKLTTIFHARPVESTGFAKAVRRDAMSLKAMNFLLTFLIIALTMPAATVSRRTNAK